MQIGRKIYYDKATGDVLIDTGEMQGDVQATTQEQDFQTFIALQQRVPDTVGCIQLAYGQYADKFGYYEYRIDPATEQIIWGNLINSNNTPQADPLQEIKDNQLTIMGAIADLYEAIAPTA